MIAQVLRGAILNPQPGGLITFLPDGALAADEKGRLEFAGAWEVFVASGGAAAEAGGRTSNGAPIRRVTGIIVPGFFDDHIHIPQHPIRGRFTEGIDGHPPGGRLLAGLARNVFPTEAKAGDDAWARQTIQEFRRDTLANGVIGGATYVTVHASAARAALEMLPAPWHVGFVLMNQNCPDYLRTREQEMEADAAALAQLGARGALNGRNRLIMTDRFAVAVDTPLRRRAVALAQRHGLRLQTHLNEQIAEKRLVEQQLYAGRGSYTAVYAQDGLLAAGSIMAHCIWMSPDEWSLFRDAGACVAHCPTSNTLLGSGIMDLEALRAHGIDYALCTDVGASPTTSLLSEMVEFLDVHAGRSAAATACEALYRVTLAPARILGLDHLYGSFATGKSCTCAIVEAGGSIDAAFDAESVIRVHLLNLPATAGCIGSSDYERLAAGDLQSGRELDRLSARIHDRIPRLERKIRGVLVDGVLVHGEAGSVFAP